MQAGLVLPLFAFLLQVTLVFGSQRFCGKHLSDSLSLVCGSRGYHWREDKKTGSPMISKRDATEFLSRGTRNGKTRGIIQECCDNPCSIAHLENYCAPTDKALDLSSTNVQRMVLDKPEGSDSASSDTGAEGESQVTSNPQLMSRLEDLRARLRGSANSRSRLASRRPFFFVRPISPRPIRVST